MDGGIVSGPITGATVSSVIATTLKLSTVLYEFKAVEEQAQDLLHSTKHVSNNLHTARTLRRQKSAQFTKTEKIWFDEVLTSTDRTLNNVKILIEPARVDMRTNFKKVGFVNRSLFVFRDSPKVQTHLARLSIASGSLDNVLGILCAREGRSRHLLLPQTKNSGWDNIDKLRRRSNSNLRVETSSPPSYHEPEFEDNLSVFSTSTHSASSKNGSWGRSSATSARSVFSDQDEQLNMIDCPNIPSIYVPYGPSELEASDVRYSGGMVPHEAVQAYKPVELDSTATARAWLGSSHSSPDLTSRPWFEESSCGFQPSSERTTHFVESEKDVSDCSTLTSSNNLGKAWLAYQANR